MGKTGKDFRSSEVLRARAMVASGVYEASLPDIADVLISGTSVRSQKFLAAVGVYQGIQEETGSRDRVSLCAAIA
jgi:hypothetical protein